MKITEMTQNGAFLLTEPVRSTPGSCLNGAQPSWIPKLFKVSMDVGAGQLVTWKVFQVRVSVLLERVSDSGGSGYIFCGLTQK